MSDIKQQKNNFAGAVILIVDDSKLNIQVLGNVLEPEGYDVAVAMNGLQALEFAWKEKPELILLDVMMPNMDGYEVCRRLKSSVATRRIPVIFLTALNSTRDIVKGFEMGGVDFITKPFQPLELLARVKTHLELKRAREEIKKLQGILPICANCKRIRDDDGYWEQVETYIKQRAEVAFTHSICPPCVEKLYPNMLKSKKVDNLS